MQKSLDLFWKSVYNITIVNERELIKNENNLAVDFESFLDSADYTGETFEEVAKEYFDIYYNKFFNYDEMVEILKEQDFDSIDYYFPE